MQGGRVSSPRDTHRLSMPNAYTRSNQTVQTHELATQRPRLEASSQPCSGLPGPLGDGVTAALMTPRPVRRATTPSTPGSNQVSYEEVKPADQADPVSQRPRRIRGSAERTPGTWPLTARARSVPRARIAVGGAARTATCAAVGGYSTHSVAACPLELERALEPSSQAGQPGNHRCAVRTLGNPTHHATDDLFTALHRVLPRGSSGSCRATWQSSRMWDSLPSILP